MKLTFTFLIFLLSGSISVVVTADPVPPKYSGYMGYPAMKQFIAHMVNKGFNQNYLVQTFSSIQRDESILAKVNSPAESKPWNIYRNIFLTEERAQTGVNFWRMHESTLNSASKKYNVPPEIIVAIIGVETFYGRNLGKYNVLRSLTTLAMDFKKRQKFYTSELEHYLQLISEEKIPDPFMLKGSYAGAMGLGQFISSSYRNFAIDYNGDGHRDLWHPEDAIGSIANYFNKHGWKVDVDVAVPARIKGNFYANIATLKAEKPKHSLPQLAQYGVTPVGNIRSIRVSLLKLQSERANEFWVVGDNFYVITRYNHNPKYAMVVYQLAKEIKRRKNIK